MRAVVFVALLQLLAVAQQPVNFASTFGNTVITASAVDSQGNTYITGFTRSTKLPVTPNALGPTFIHAVCGYLQGPHGTAGPPLDCEHGFAAKIDPTGTRVLYATYIGGEQQDYIGSMALDAEGNVYLHGNSSSKTFPVTPGAYQTTGRGFLMKLNADGSKALFSTRLPGSAGSLERTADGSLYVTGSSSENYLPGDAYLLRLTTDGSKAVYKTLLGKTHANVPLLKVDAEDNVYLASSGAAYNSQSDITISKLDASGAGLLYATTFRAAGAITSMDIDAEGAVYFAVNSSSDFPLPVGTARLGSGSTYVAKLAPDGSGLVYRTDLIASRAAFIRLKAGEAGRLFLSSRVYGRYLKFGSSVDPDCYPFQGGDNDFSWFGFVGELSADGDKFRFATGLGSYGVPFVDSQGRYWTPSYSQLLEKGDPFNPVPGIHCVTNAASKRKGPVAPGELITLHGSGIEGATVYINGVLAPTLDTAPDRIDAVVPFSLDTQAPATIHLLQPNMQPNMQPTKADPPEFTVATAEAAPGAYSRDGTGYGRLALWNEDGSINSPEFPALTGSVVLFYVTGLGKVDPTPPDGAVSQQKYGTKPRLLPKVSLVTGLYGTLPVEVVYYGSAPGHVEGLTQVEIRIPANVRNVPQFLQLSAGSAQLSNSPGLYVYVRTP